MSLGQYKKLQLHFPYFYQQFKFFDNVTFNVTEKQKVVLTILTLTMFYAVTDLERPSV